MKKPERIQKPMGRPPKFDGGVALVVHVGLDRAQAEWITTEWHRRGLQTRVDAIRAILDEAMKQK
jgi:hypothetical protein